MVGAPAAEGQRGGFVEGRRARREAYLQQLLRALAADGTARGLDGGGGGAGGGVGVGAEFLVRFCRQEAEATGRERPAEEFWPEGGARDGEGAAAGGGSDNSGGGGGGGADASAGADAGAGASDKKEPSTEADQGSANINTNATANGSGSGSGSGSGRRESAVLAAFRAEAIAEAAALGAASYGESFLEALGWVYENQAEQFLGENLSGALASVSLRSHMLGTQVGRLVGSLVGW
jgi:hypothetical protein